MTQSRTNSAQVAPGGAGDDVDAPKPPAHYAQRADAGDETWIEDAIEDYLDIQVGEAQGRICRAVANNKQLLVVSANSLGKSYILAAITIVWLFCRYPAVAFATSGTERKMKRTYCKPVESLHGSARIPLPGEYKSRPERIEIDGEPEHFFEASSPRDAGELEGVHGAFTLSIIEEADKSAVDEDVIEAMRSLATDNRDRLILIANPPKDETNSIYPLMDDHPNWEVLRFSTFDAHNVQVELGNIDAEKIDGVAGISKLRDDWVEHNGTDWPGIRTALRVSAPKLSPDGDLVFERDEDLPDNPDFRKDLSQRWYRRRAGIMPPEGAAAHRPIETSAVKAAWGRATPVSVRETPRTVGIDVARSSDKTVMVGEHTMELRVHYSERGTNHEVQKQDVVAGTSTTPGLKEWPAPEVAVDKGYAPGFHDYVADRVPNVVDFQNGTKPVELTRWYDKWAEALFHFGEWLEDGGVIADQDLREEAVVASRVVEFSKRTLDSRGQNGAEVYEATSKDEIKEELGHSPDHLDAALMAIWRLRTDAEAEEEDSTWYDPFE